ncbi:MAG: hypothetical protein WB586_16035 [Chthoniobacterales bacterium]
MNVTDNTEITPEWSRIKAAAASIGIRQSRFYELLAESNGAIRSIILKSPGAKRGAHLISLRDLYAYLDRLAEQEVEQAAAQ